MCNFHLMVCKRGTILIRGNTSIKRLRIAGVDVAILKYFLLDFVIVKATIVT